MDEDFLSLLDNLSKPRAERKKEEYLKKLKEKKFEKKKNKKIKDKQNNNTYENNIESIESNDKQTSITDRNQNDDLKKLIHEEKIEIEYVDEDLLSNPKMYDNFKNVFEYFIIPKKDEKKEALYSDEDDENDNEYDENNEEINNNNQTIIDKNISKKKKKLMKRIKISELKSMTEFPEVVEAWDNTAQDPPLLIKLKSLKNTIAVPSHWSNKRTFLQSKRGILKQAFKLPDFIEATGIGKIRDTSGHDRKALKLKMRERMQPKLGKMDIDYQILHDAFFRYQTKPKLTIHGEVYHECKDYENKMKLYKPGRISEKLRNALGIPENTPPPWIINMQRYGPPPSYSNLKIPGVNAHLLDPTSEITPNLWTPPILENKATLVYDFKRDNVENHWGDIKELEEDELSDDLDDDISLVDENDRPNVDNLFSGMDIDNEKVKYASIKSENEIDLTNAVPNPNANLKNRMNTHENNFYTILEQRKSNIKQDEIYGSSHGYLIPTESNNIQSKEEENENKEVEVKQDEKTNPTVNKKKEKKTTTFKF